MTNIEKKYLDKSSFASKGIILFSKEIALQIIQDCKKENLQIFGIDGFYIWNIVGKTTKIGIQPDLSYSTDYSNETNEESYRKSIEFIKSAEDNRLFFEIVTNDEKVESIGYVKVNDRVKWIPDRTIKNPYLPDDYFEE